MQLGLLAARGHEPEQATILSIEAQLVSLFAAAMAPVVGAVVDAFVAGLGTPAALWPLGLLALPTLLVRAPLGRPSKTLT